MKVFTNALIIFILILSLATIAAAAPAGEKSIKQLLAVTETHKIADSVLARMNAQMNNFVQTSLKGNNPTAKQQKAISKMKDRMVAVIREELSWEKLEPMYIRLYKETFTEEEVAGMLKFYKTPAGRAVIKKMPTLMQNIMQESQKIIVGATTPRIQKIQDDFEEEIKEAGN